MLTDKSITTDKWHDAVATTPLIAILRGITTAESLSIGKALVTAGFKLIEVPLNSPTPLQTIELLQTALGSEALIGAGTVLSADQANDVINVGAKLIVAPNFSPDVARACEGSGAIYCPGVATPTEAFNALNAGAHGLKLFPAELISPSAVKAMRAVLPPDSLLIPVGGITPQNIPDYLKAGARGFGIGSALYKPGITPQQIAENARVFIEAVSHTTPG